MTNPPTLEAKQQVLDWVRSKNPQTMEFKFGCRVKCLDCPGKITERMYAGRRNHGECLHICADNVEYLWRMDQKYEILGSDMGLQELLIALADEKPHIHIMSDAIVYIEFRDVENESWEVEYDLTQNLHSQSEEFYNAILPLISE